MTAASPLFASKRWACSGSHCKPTACPTDARSAPQHSQIWAVLHTSTSDDRIVNSVAATFLGRMCQPPRETAVMTRPAIRD